MITKSVPLVYNTRPVQHPGNFSEPLAINPLRTDDVFVASSLHCTEEIIAAKDLQIVTYHREETKQDYDAVTLPIRVTVLLAFFPYKLITELP